MPCHVRRSLRRCALEWGSRGARPAAAAARPPGHCGNHPVCARRKSLCPVQCAPQRCRAAGRASAVARSAGTAGIVGRRDHIRVHAAPGAPVARATRRATAACSGASVRREDRGDRARGSPSAPGVQRGDGGAAPCARRWVVASSPTAGLADRVRLRGMDRVAPQREDADHPGQRVDRQPVEALDRRISVHVSGARLLLLRCRRVHLECERLAGVCADARDQHALPRHRLVHRQLRSRSGGGMGAPRSASQLGQRGPGPHARAAASCSSPGFSSSRQRSGR